MEPSGVTEGAAYSGLPKRTSLGTKSASAAEKCMAVRDFMAVGRLRGAVKAAADAAIATKTFAKLLIFETKSDAQAFCLAIV